MKREFCLCDSKNGEQPTAWLAGVIDLRVSQPQGYSHPNHGERRIYEWEEKKGEDSLEDAHM